MTELEAEVWAQKLTHAWGVKELDAVPRCTFEGKALRFECDLAPQVHLRVVGQSATTRAAMIQWQRCELVHNEGKLKQFKPVSAEVEEWQSIEAFIALWWPRFRRGCYLSGLPLQTAPARRRSGWDGITSKPGATNTWISLHDRSARLLA